MPLLKKHVYFFKNVTIAHLEKYSHSRDASRINNKT